MLFFQRKSCITRNPCVTKMAKVRWGFQASSINLVACINYSKGETSVKLWSCWSRNQSSPHSNTKYVQWHNSRYFPFFRKSPFPIPVNLLLTHKSSSLGKTVFHATHHSPHSILLTDYSSFSTPQLLALALHPNHHLPPWSNPRFFFPNQTIFIHQLFLQTGYSKLPSPAPSQIKWWVLPLP